MDKAADRKARRDAARKDMDHFLDRWKRRGALPFEDFMSAALFHETFGYYSRNIHDVGVEGDFSTSATIGNDLGAAIARWIVRESSEVFPWRWRVHVVEVGAGNGALAETVLTSLPWHFRVRCHCHIVEKSEALTAVQKERLERLQRFPGPRISWHPDMDSVLRKTSRFILFSNELVDAFPASVFRWAAGADISGGGPGNTHDPGEKGRWDKLFLRIHENGLFEEFQPVSHYELADLTSIFDPGQWPGNTPPHGQRCEVHFSYREWLHAWVPRSRCVSMLTIDYGDIMPAIYHRNPGGTMRAYFRHNHLTGADVYSNMGGQDLTCDVNFSDLIQWGLELDLESQPLMTQAEFLDAFGDPHESSAGVDPGAAAASSFLRMEEGAGSAFKVLVQRRTTPNT